MKHESIHRRGDIATAQREFQRATEDAPADACIAYYYLGHIRLKQSKFNDAATYYDKETQRLCASFTDAHLAVALAYQRAGRIDQARKKYLEIRQNFPQSPAATVAIKKLTELP